MYQRGREFLKTGTVKWYILTLFKNSLEQQNIFLNQGL